MNKSRTDNIHTTNHTTGQTNNHTTGDTELSSKIPSQNSSLLSAAMASVPLSLAVIPWGILCATLCINIGMSSVQAQMMSLLVCAGAAQLSGTAILGAGGSWLGLLNSTAMISVRHLLYSASYKDDVSILPLWKRLLFAFLLTDEMFAIAQTEQNKTGKFDYWYAVVAGFSFYAVWNVATFAGIFFAQQLKDIDKMGFDFAIVATFIAMVVPMIKEGGDKQKVLFIAASVSGALALLFELVHLSQGLIVAGLIGMAVGAVLSRFARFVQPVQDNAQNSTNSSQSKDSLAVDLDSKSNTASKTESDVKTDTKSETDQ